MLTTALGILRWTPEQFWDCSYYPFSCAVKGYLASKGIKPDNGVMTRNELLDLIAEDERRMKLEQSGG